jgi:flavin-dependent dehydrogenase
MKCEATTCDVIILGGGPAGTAAALVLARAGLRVAVLERSAYDSLRMGETFPPEICVPLQRLGVWERFRSAGHLESPGILSCWGRVKPFEHDFIFDAYGCGWHVDRLLFDRMLADAAREAGASVWLLARAQHCARAADGTWRVKARYAGRTVEFRADYLIDAAGRAGSPGQERQPGTRYDRLLGCVAFLVAHGKQRFAETRTVIEARPEGWWYSAPLPQGRLVIALMADADLLPVQANDAAAFYWQRLRETSLTQRWLADFTPAAPLRHFAAHTGVRPAAAAKRLATGDAALAFDPLSAQGTLKALTYGQQAALTILAECAGDVQAVPQYAAKLAQEFRHYSVLHRKYYQAELRWITEPFWRRRRGI